MTDALTFIGCLVLIWFGWFAMTELDKTNVSIWGLIASLSFMGAGACAYRTLT